MATDADGRGHVAFCVVCASNQVCIQLRVRERMHV